MTMSTEISSPRLPSATYQQESKNYQGGAPVELPPKTLESRTIYPHDTEHFGVGSPTVSPSNFEKFASLVLDEMGIGNDDEGTALPQPSPQPRVRRAAPPPPMEAGQ